MNTTALLFSFATLVGAIGIAAITTPALAQVDIPAMDGNVTTGMDESLPPMDGNTMDENVTIEMNESLPPSG